MKINKKQDMREKKSRKIYPYISGKKYLISIKDILNFRKLFWLHVTLMDAISLKVDTVAFGIIPNLINKERNKTRSW